MNLLLRRLNFAILTAVTLCASFTNAMAQTDGGLSIEKSVEPFFRKGPVYSWSYSYSTFALDTDIAKGESASVKHSLFFQRFSSAAQGTYGVRGEICVHNRSKSALRSIVIRDVVQARSLNTNYLEPDWEDLEVTDHLVASNIDLNVGEKRCFDYETLLPLGSEEYSQLRNVATAIVGSKGKKTFNAIEPFSVATAKEEPGVTDYSLHIKSLLECPEGFSCLGGPPGPEFTIHGDTTFNWHLIATNESVECGQTRQVRTRLETETSDSRRKATIQSTNDFTTGACSGAAPLRNKTPNARKFEGTIGQKQTSN